MIIETIILFIICALSWIYIGPLFGALLTGIVIMKTLAMVLEVMGSSLATIDTWPPFSAGRGEKYSLSMHRNRHGDFYGYLGPYFAFELTKWKPDSGGAEKEWTWVLKDEPPRTEDEAREMGWPTRDYEY